MPPIKKYVKRVCALAGIAIPDIAERISAYSLHAVIRERRYRELLDRLRSIVPDISNQESSEIDSFNAYTELKRRALQSFQCRLMLKALENEKKSRLTVVDIGDSAGTHMLYLKELAKDIDRSIDTISVNLDPRAIERIQSRGLKALQCRAENLDLKGQNVDLFTSFQMVEHLHNPAIFFRRLAKMGSADRLLMTVPYVRHSRVGLHSLRNGLLCKVYAEDEHIFELSPGDWELLLRHSGWDVEYQEIFFQYPQKWPILRTLFAEFWRRTDFEGFLGMLLKRNTYCSDLYQDWED